MDKEASILFIARITKPQGLKGAVRIDLIFDDERNFAPGRRVIVAAEAGESESEIEFFRRQHGRCILKLRAVDSIEDAEKLIGCKIGIRNSELLAAPEGSFYTFQLKGCAVFEGDELIGTVADVLDNGAVEILKVDRDGQETLIPFAEAFLKKIDLSARRIDVDLPEGLRDINK